jgi:Flp pilus assembly protein TadB
MEPMTTTLLDRVVHWSLDLDGDIYGDERERLRWYEGMATASALQSIAIPWAAAVMVWVLGRPSVLPLSVLLALLLVPTWLAAAYVRSRRVDTVPRRWSGKRVLISTLSVLPIVVFLIGVEYVRSPQSSTWQGAIVGVTMGGGIGWAMTAAKVRRRRREDAAIVGDED